MLLLAVTELRVERVISDWMISVDAVAGVEAEDDDEEEEEDPVQLGDVMEKSEKVVVLSGLM